MKNIISLVLLLCFSLRGQSVQIAAKPEADEVTPTHIGKHKIGETLQDWFRLKPDAVRNEQSEISPHRTGETFGEWLTLNQIDLGNICQKHKRSDKLMDYQSVCKKLSAIQETGQGEFYTTGESGRTLGWLFNGGRMTRYSVGDGAWQDGVPADAKDSEIVTTANGRSYDWEFTDGKLSAVSVTPDWKEIYSHYSREAIASHPEAVPAFPDEINLLTHTYGKPSKLESVPYGNALGAHWERSRAMWSMEDGTVITAFEGFEFDQQGQLALVTFHSKEYLKQRPQDKPNPYKQ